MYSAHFNVEYRRFRGSQHATLWEKYGLINQWVLLQNRILKRGLYYQSSKFSKKYFVKLRSSNTIQCHTTNNQSSNPHICFFPSIVILMLFQLRLGRSKWHTSSPYQRFRMQWFLKKVIYIRCNDTWLPQAYIYIFTSICMYMCKHVLMRMHGSLYVYVFV